MSERRWLRLPEGDRARGRLAVLVTVAAIVAIAFVLETFDRARTDALARVKSLRASSQQVERSAAEIERLRAAARGTSPRLDPRAIVEAEARAAGIAQTMRVERADANEITVAFARVRFADWLDWVERLQTSRLTLRQSRIETLTPDGWVIATATLVGAP